MKQETSYTRWCIEDNNKWLTIDHILTLDILNAMQFKTQDDALNYQENHKLDDYKVTEHIFM